MSARNDNPERLGEEMNEQKLSAMWPAKDEAKWLAKNSKDAKLNGSYVSSRFYLYVSYSFWVTAAAGVLLILSGLDLMPPLVQGLWSRSSNLRGSWQYGLNVTTVVGTASISWAMNSLKPCQHWRGGKRIREKLRILNWCVTT